MNHLGRLRMGRVPYVVGTITSAASLKAFAGQRVEACDIIEVRLDQIGQTADWLSLSAEIENSGTPVILTTRVRSEGGKWPDDDKSRLFVIREGLAQVSAVDVEFKSDLMAQVCGDAKALKKAVIVSYHDFEKTPSFEELKAIAMKAAKHGTIVKISTMVKGDQDIATLEKLLDSGLDVPVCIIGMGALGTKTRITFPAHGSCLTYGYLDTASAPGQLPAKMLNEHLAALSGGAG
ncbi:MAG: type I 3-dehydroquinate dehydratase [Limisphaerales bacterium]